MIAPALQAGELVPADLRHACRLRARRPSLAGSQLCPLAFDVPADHLLNASGRLHIEESHWGNSNAFAEPFRYRHQRVPLEGGYGLRATVSRSTPSSTAIRRLDQRRAFKDRIASIRAILSRFAMRQLLRLGISWRSYPTNQSLPKWRHFRRPRLAAFGRSLTVNQANSSFTFTTTGFPADDVVPHYAILRKGPSCGPCLLKGLVRQVDPIVFEETAVLADPQRSTMKDRLPPVRSAVRQT